MTNRSQTTTVGECVVCMEKKRCHLISGHLWAALNVLHTLTVSVQCVER